MPATSDNQPSNSEAHLEHRCASATGSEVRISQSGDCKVIEAPGWTMHILKDGYRLLPPPGWLLELVELIENKTISHASAKIVIETWQQDTLCRIGVGLEKLRNIGELNPPNDKLTHPAGREGGA